MSFANYADLKIAVASWLNREDQETRDRIPDFIEFGENSLFRRLRTRFNEIDLLFDAQINDNVQGILLPDDYLEAKLVTYDGRALTRKSDQWYLTRDPNAAAGDPLNFARITDTLKFWRPPDANNDVRLIYYNQQVHIDDNNTPAMYLRAPELYLFGALLDAEPFLKHKDKVPVWQARWDKVFNELMDESWGDEYSGSTVSVSSAYNDDNRNSARVVGGL